MKLYLNNTQRNLLLEILRSSENNAIHGKDVELANSFSELYRSIEPKNLAYVSLDRADAETIVEFCEVVRRSLDKAIAFLNKDTERSANEIEDLKDEAEKARDQIEEIVNQLQDKIKKNPVQGHA